MEAVGKNLKRIRLLKNLSLKEAGLLLNMSAPAISKYEKGLIIPDSKKLIEFANAYDVKVLDLLKEIIQNKVANYLEVLNLNEIKTPNHKLKKYPCNNETDAELAADEFRKNYKLSINQPIPDLINILENIGILIIEIDNPHQKFSDFDGLSEIVSNIPLIVLLNDAIDLLVVY